MPSPHFWEEWQLLPCSSTYLSHWEMFYFRFLNHTKINHGNQTVNISHDDACLTCVHPSHSHFWQILLAKRMEDVLEQAFEDGWLWKQHSKLWQNPQGLYLTNTLADIIRLLPLSAIGDQKKLYGSNKERQVTIIIISETHESSPVPPSSHVAVFIAGKPPPPYCFCTNPFPSSSFCMTIHIVYKLFI